MRQESPEERDAVIAEALSWQGTPFHNGARIKGAGVDCGQYPLACYAAVGLIPEIKTQRYSEQFMLHRNEEWYRGYCESLGRQLPDGVLPKKGDFALYKFGRIYSHGAIVIDWPRIIHSWTGQGVIQGVGDQGHLLDREVIFYTLWEE